MYSRGSAPARMLEPALGISHNTGRRQGEGRLAPEVAAFLEVVDEEKLRGWFSETGALRCWCDSLHLNEMTKADRPAADEERQKLLQLVLAPSLPHLPPAGFTANFGLLVELQAKVRFSALCAIP